MIEKNSSTASETRNGWKFIQDETTHEDKFIKPEMTISDVNNYLNNLFAFMFVQKLAVYFSLSYFKINATDNLGLFFTSLGMIFLLLILLVLRPQLLSKDPRQTFAYLLFTISLCFVFNQGIKQTLLGLILIDIIASFVIYSGKKSSRSEIIVSIFIIILGSPLVSYALSQSLSRALIYALYSSFLLLGVVVRLRRSLEIIQVLFSRNKPER